ncbi:uncharacterized protein FFUJ_04665 [Fusarium fujikuroi IMI 58289]|uniref:Uncharacterized protein n=1 Tax=Gibberella fujikuroi (strain CBS 195.34 / IMI 58289 / NRRL A-6831) TaxID=1279085 RepID=S0DNI9_GIBF5|nr:uncharacterized protein FFUJ_04665 [Fusarium fujikuroi IMI 58289]CCT64144.1 uncharacterized protein FFUJ_04665 [Fusarium fujikuroi IMI 58289]
MPDNAPNRGDDDDAVSSDDGYRNKKRLHFPTVFDRREIVNPGGSAAAEEFGQKLLTGHERRFVEELRVTKVQFYQLADWISVNTSMKGSSRQSLHLKLMIFLYVIGQGCTQRAAAHHFGVSQSSVSRIMATGLEAFADIHRTFVVQPEPTEVCHEPITKPKSAWVPEEGQRKWYNRKSLITQNVLCAVRLDGTFSYVLAGCEGSVNDASLLRHARSKSLKLYADRFYVGDAGFGACTGLLVPYIGIRYHLNDWKVSLEGPQNKEELYNLRHSRLRIIVELTFGRVKRKFRIMRSSPPEYDIYKQILIVYACTGLWNFLKSLEEKPALNKAQEEYLQSMTAWARDNLPSDPEVLRDEIAIDQWEEHLAYIEEMRQYNNAILQRKHEKHLGDEEWKAARHFRLER